MTFPVHCSSIIQKYNLPMLIDVPTQMAADIVPLVKRKDTKQLWTPLDSLQKIVRNKYEAKMTALNKNKAKFVDSDYQELLEKLRWAFYICSNGFLTSDYLKRINSLRRSLPEARLIEEGTTSSVRDLNTQLHVNGGGWKSKA